MTINVFKVQRLLQLLGQDIQADGFWGPLSEAALDAEIKKQEQPEAPTTGGSWWYKYPNWTREEFRCRCGGKYCKGFPAEPQEKLVALLQKIRDHYGKPCLRESGLRCEIWNQKSGGVATSKHRLGRAMDFRIQGEDPNEIVSWVRANCPECSYTYAIKRADGSYAGTVHVDV